MAKSLLEKLNVKAPAALLLINAPQGYRASLAPLPAGVSVTEEPGGRFDAVHYFARDSGDLMALLPQAAAALVPGGVLWVSYPKKTSGIETDLGREEVWLPLQVAGWQAVRQVAVDDVWSAVRFKQAAPEADPIAAQYAGEKAALRPIYDALVAAARNLGDDVTLGVRQSYVTLQRGNSFAAIAPATRTRVDLALKLKGVPPGGRLEANTGVGGGALTHKVALGSADEVDGQVREWLRTAYEGAAAGKRAK
jgi:hypothetical protein